MALGGRGKRERNEREGRYLNNNISLSPLDKLKHPQAFFLLNDVDFYLCHL